jgi:hypothetical protein
MYDKAVALSVVILSLALSVVINKNPNQNRDFRETRVMVEGRVSAFQVGLGGVCGLLCWRPLRLFVLARFCIVWGL